MRTVLLVVLVLLMGAGLALAEGRSVEAEGRGLIVDGRTDIARERAAKDAFRNALEQAMGVMVESETVMKNLKLISDNIYSRTAGYIESYSVLSQRIEGDDVVVTIRAVVKEKALRDDLNALGVLLQQVGMPRTLILVGIRDADDAAGADAASSVLTEHCGKLGLPLVNPEAVFAGEDMAAVTALAGSALGRTALLEKAAAGEAEVVIAAVADVQQGETLAGTSIRSCQAVLKVSLLDPGTGAELFTVTKTGLAAHVNMLTGCGEAMQKAAREAAPLITDRLMEKWRVQASSTNTVRVVVEGIAYGEALAFHEFLKEHVMGAVSVIDRGFYDSTARFDLTGDFTGREVSQDIDGAAFGGETLSVIASSAGRVTVLFHRDNGGL